MTTNFSTWKKGEGPKDRQFLAFALAEGNRDAPGTVAPVRVVAEWDPRDEIYRPVKVDGEPMTSIALNVLCWIDLPPQPKI